jgi:hypothetical protein
MILDASELKSLYLDQVKQRNREITSLAADSEPFFTALWATVSEDSRVHARLNSGHDAAFKASDPNLMFIVLKESHLTKIWGDGADDKLDALVDKRKEFLHCEQSPTDTVGKYQKKLTDMDLVLVGMGEKPTSQKELAMMCINGLDPTRHQDLQLAIKNKTRPRPETLAEVCTMAASWVSKDTAPPMRGVGGASQISTLVLADSVRSSSSSRPLGRPQQPARPAGPPRPTAPASSGDKRGRPRPPAPPPPVSAKVGNGVDQPKPRPPPRPPQTEVRESDNDRECWHCHQTGHVWHFCPEYGHGQQAFIAIGNEEDEEETYETAFRGLAISRALAAAAGRGEFSPNTLVFDSAACFSIVWNSMLCHDVTAIESPYNMGGVEKDSVGVLVSHEGVLPEFGAVHIADNSVANILSQVVLTDAGCKIELLNDEYHVTARGSTQARIFCRRLLRGSGEKSMFYTHSRQTGAVCR